MEIETEVVFEPGYERLRAPGAVLIEGLPGVGLVAKTAVAYLLEKLGGEKICRFYSPYFPTIGYVREGKLILNFADLYYVGKPKPMYLLYGNAQPSSYYGQHDFCEKILDVASGLGANFILTLGGYGKEGVSEERAVYVSSTRPETIEKALDVLKAEAYEGQIIGAAGLLITLAEEKGLDNLSMLIEAGETAPDFPAARKAIEAVVKFLDLNIEVDDIYGISKAYASALKRFES